MHSEAVRLLLMARADALARNFGGREPHRLCESGSQIWQALVAELAWRAALEAPRPCYYVDAGTSLLPGSLQPVLARACMPQPASLSPLHRTSHDELAALHSVLRGIQSHSVCPFGASACSW